MKQLSTNLKKIKIHRKCLLGFVNLVTFVNSASIRRNWCTDLLGFIQMNKGLMYLQLTAGRVSR